MAIARHEHGLQADLRALLSQVHPVFMLPPLAASWFGAAVAGEFALSVGAIHMTAIFFAVYTAHVKDGYVDFHRRGEDDDHPMTIRGCRLSFSPPASASPSVRSRSGIRRPGRRARHPSDLVHRVSPRATARYESAHHDAGVPERHRARAARRVLRPDDRDDRGDTRIRARLPRDTRRGEDHRRRTGLRVRQIDRQTDRLGTARPTPSPDAGVLSADGRARRRSLGTVDGLFPRRRRPRRSRSPR